MIPIEVRNAFAKAMSSQDQADAYIESQFHAMLVRGDWQLAETLTAVLRCDVAALRDAPDGLLVFVQELAASRWNQLAFHEFVAAGRQAAEAGQ